MVPSFLPFLLPFLLPLPPSSFSPPFSLFSPHRREEWSPALSQESSNRTPQLKNVLQTDRRCSHVRSKRQVPRVELTAIT